MIRFFNELNLLVDTIYYNLFGYTKVISSDISVYSLALGGSTISLYRDLWTTV